MAANVQSLVQYWKNFDLPQIQKALDVTATELANRQDESDNSRKKLVELSRDFKKNSTEDIRKAVVPLLKSFQAEVDSLSKRSKAAEAAFLTIYRTFIELPDPVPALEHYQVLLQRTMRIQDLEIENRHLRETLNDYSRELKSVRNQEVTIKLLREKVREFEDKEESIVQEKAEEKDPELLHLFDEKESDPLGSEYAIKSNLEEAETKVAQLQSALDRSQSELFDLKSRYDEDSNAKSDEMEIIVNDLERANQRAALAEKEVNHLKDQLAAAKQSLQLADQIQKAPDMEQAVDVVARSSLELELASKEKEISQLVDDIQRLQAILNTLQETSASKIAQLEELVNEKDKMIVELGEKLVRQQDYDEIKKELSILKSIEYVNSRAWESRDENKNQSDKPPDLTKENHKSVHTDNNTVKSIKTEENGSSQSYPLHSVDSFGTMLGQEIVTNYAQNVAKEEVCSRPSSPVSKSSGDCYPPSSTTSITSTNSHEDRKPSPPILEAASPTSAVNLTSERSSPSSTTHQPSIKELASPVNCDNSANSLGNLQECLRHNIDKYANETLNTLNIARCVRELLSVHNIGQRLFAKFVLGLSQGTVSELLSKPKPWDKLTEKGRDSYRKMHAWASDDQCINMLKTLVPRRVAERKSSLLSSPPGKDCVGGSGGGGVSSYKSDDQGAEERIAQILNEAQMAMMKQQEQKSPSSLLPNGNSGENRSVDSCDEIRGDREGNDSKLNHGNSRDASNASDKSFRRSRKYENDDIPQEMVARIYQEELAKLIGQRVEEGFRTPRDQFERTQEEIRQALTIYHQELTRLSHLMPPNHHPNFNPFSANGSSYNLSHLHNNNSSSSTINNNPNNVNNGQTHQECPVDATIGSRSRSESKNNGGSGREEPEMRHHGSAFSLVRPKTEPNISSSMNSKSSSTPTPGSYRHHSPSPAPPALLPLSDSKTSSPGAPQSSTEDLTTSASPLQRMQSITNSLLSQSSLPSLPNPPQRPAKAVLPPITQQQFDQYNNVNTEDIVKKVKEQLSQYSISQRLFGESVLGLSQGSVSDLLARPKPWHMLTQKGREPFIRMKIFLEDENAVHKLVASQYKIAPEKLMRTGSFGGATNPQGIMSFGGSNKMSPRPMDNNLRTPDNRQLTQNNSVYSSHNHTPRSVCVTPDTMPMSLTVTSSNTPVTHSRKTPSLSRGYNQPSVYEMAALTTDLDTQIITSKIKETLMAHNIGQKIFGEAVLGLSQGSVSELLSKPKPWHMLSIKGREPFIRMQMWLNDPHNVEMLQTLKNERREANKRRRTGEGPMDSPRSQSDGGQMYNSYSFAPPSPYPPAKKPRVLFTEEQKEALKLAFSLDPYPSTATIEFLANELTLSVRTITNWFHNHRMRMKQHTSDDEHSRKGSDLSLPPPVREGMAFEPVQYRLLLNQRLAEKCREKQPQFAPYGSNMPYLYSPYRNCSPLSSSGDDVGTLDLSMSSQLRNAMNSGVKADTTNGSSTDDRSNSEINDDSNLSQDNLMQGDNSDRDSIDDGQSNNHREASPLRPPAPSEQVRPTTGGGSSNRRKPAMPQWVDPGLELSPDNTDDEDDGLDDEDRLGDESATEQEEIINGVCVRQTEDFDLLMSPRVETVHVLPVPAPDERSSSKCHTNRNEKNRRTAMVSPDRSDNEVEGLTNGVGDRDTSESNAKSKLLCARDSATLKKPVFLEEQDDDDDESWDDAEAKDRRKNIEKLQQRLEKEDVGEDWEF
ncbi:homeobox protein cut-like 1 isoform X1 [Argiope bruennichi]|uniref:homeobox protein cut-like 1 isoform X1 n=2 Tax=Argiope bruennichi TaxID=94029 RepID=UPI002494225B|nr:homeobox protein cut-like 1 isoform X1 [Argiope bruennichi]